jgi:hypothetical protein
VTSELALLPSSRTVRRCDLGAAATVLVFTVLGILTAAQLWGLGDLPRNLAQAGDALDQTARAIALVGDLPVVGNGADRLAESVRSTAAEMRASAASVGGHLHALAVLIGITIVAIPVLPVVVLYLPVRLARLRELRELQQALQGPAVDPALIEHLARAALRRVPYQELHEISPRPWLDVEQGHHRHLAAAELRRLGIRPPAWQGRGATPRDG